ncbi:MAG: TetR/AcrR family transcriptional regulator [Bacteroidetes bacterium]|jgi:TetR/AcrR family transcriptional regulator|nr:TetR/AcrR family transcriptional regulator [Bacteroidota bacterium]
MGITERKVRDRERRLNDIIDAAEKVFFKKGVDAATMDDIAHEAELSKGTLYLYFKNKEDLHYAIIIRGMTIMTELFKKHLSETKNGLQNIISIGKAYIEFFEKHYSYFQVMMEFHATKFDKIADDKKGKILEKDSPLIIVSQTIQQGQDDKSIRQDINPSALTFILWSQLNGFLEFVALRGKLLDVFELDKSEMIENQFNVLLNGIINNEANHE